VNIHDEFSGVDISKGKLVVFLVWVTVTTFRRFSGSVKEPHPDANGLGPISFCWWFGCPIAVDPGIHPGVMALHGRSAPTPMINVPE
jgi:hypothetical protein